MNTPTLEQLVSDRAANPPAPATPNGEVSRSCSALTRAAIQHVIDAIAAAEHAAAENNRDNGQDAPGAEYPDAAPAALGHLSAAHEKMTYLQTWLDQNGLFTPDGHVSNPGGAYSTYNYVREAVWQLHHARHWSAVSAVWNSRRGADHARQCIDLICDLLMVLEPLGTNATHCYLSPYFA